MSQKTPFAGLTELDVSESILEDNGAFTGRDRATIDRFLQIGAKTHRHDGSAGLSNPTNAPSAAVVGSGGTIAASLSLNVGYTAQDGQRGETVLSPVATVSTSGPLNEPQHAPSAEVKYDAGNLTQDNYYYGITYVDAEGGETPLGPVVVATRQPGHPNARVSLSHINDGMEAAGATAWRLYRQRAGGVFAFLASGTTATYMDEGAVSPVCDINPPNDNFNTTNSVNTLIVTLPILANLPTGTEFINLYLSQSGTFSGQTFLEQFPVASAGQTIVYGSLELQNDQPPDVNTSIGGAGKIDSETEIENFHWLPPVESIEDLPTEGNEEGDVRAILDAESPTLYEFINGEWQLVELGAGGALTFEFPGGERKYFDGFGSNTIGDGTWISDGVFGVNGALIKENHIVGNSSKGRYGLVLANRVLDDEREWRMVVKSDLAHLNGDINLVPSYIDSKNLLRAYLEPNVGLGGGETDVLRIQKKVNGTTSTLVEVTGKFVGESGNVWLETEVIGSVLFVRAYTTDPDEGGTPVKSTSKDFSADPDRAKFFGVRNQVGFSQLPEASGDFIDSILVEGLLPYLVYEGVTNVRLSGNSGVEVVGSATASGNAQRLSVGVTGDKAGADLTIAGSGIYFDGFSTGSALSAPWDSISDLSKLQIADGVLRPRAQIEGIGALLDLPDFEVSDQAVSYKFHTGAAPGGDFTYLGAIRLRTNEENYVEFSLGCWTPASFDFVLTQISTQGSEITETLLEDESLTLERNKDYWLRAIAKGNDLTIEVWDTEPAGGREPILRETVSITDPTAQAKVGAGQSGTTSWLVPPVAPNGWFWDDFSFISGQFYSPSLLSLIPGSGVTIDHEGPLDLPVVTINAEGGGGGGEGPKLSVEADGTPYSDVDTLEIEPGANVTVSSSEPEAGTARVTIAASGLGAEEPHLVEDDFPGPELNAEWEEFLDEFPFVEEEPAFEFSGGLHAQGAQNGVNLLRKAPIKDGAVAIEFKRGEASGNVEAGIIGKYIDPENYLIAWHYEGTPYVEVLGKWNGEEIFNLFKSGEGIAPDKPASNEVVKMLLEFDSGGISIKWWKSGSVDPDWANYWSTEKLVEENEAKATEIHELLAAEGKPGLFLKPSSGSLTITEWFLYTQAERLRPKIAEEGMGFIFHGEDEEATRPRGWRSVTWMGKVEPLNMLNGDIWIETP